MLLKFPDCFDVDMAYQLRERDADTLEKMQKNDVIVEINILARKFRLRNEKRVTIKEEPSTSETKLDLLARTLDRVVDRLENMEIKPNWENQPQIRNPNFRKNNNPGKAKEAAPDQNIIPPFQQNYAESSQNQHDDEEDINIVMGGDDNETIFLTQEDLEVVKLQQISLDSNESFDFKQGYDLTIN